MDTWKGVIEKLEFDRVLQRVTRYISSEPGAELLQKTEILVALPEIRLALGRVTEMKRLLEEEDTLPLSGVQPIKASLQKSGVEGTVLLPKELLQIASTSRASRLIRSLFSRRQNEFPLLWEICEPLEVDKLLEFNIERAIDDSGTVRSNASKELQTVRRGIAERSEHLHKRLEGILRQVADSGFSQEEIITTREGRMVIPVKAEHKNRVQGFIHSASSSGATVFIEPTETLELNNEIRSLQFEEQREIERILRALTEQVRGSKDGLLRTLGLLATLDALHAKARYSIEILGIEPPVSESIPMHIVGARHPVLLMHHGQTGPVPLDLDLGGEFKTLVISGPNAGGKSVAMKCVGLLCLMAQAGMHVPSLEGTTLRVFTGIFVDIGDEQSIENDLSTFSSHLRNLQSIASEAHEGSLVLIDEIGSGTDPAEGGAIAAAVLEWLTTHGALTIATTHHSALKVFAHDTEGVQNGAMEFDQATLTPTYRFRSGVPGSSYAVEMAQRLGFPGEILNLARGHLGQQQARLDTLIGNLESSLQRARSQAEEIAREKRALEERVRDYDLKFSTIQTEIKELKRKALEDADAILAQANAAIERSVREIRETKGDAGVIKSARHHVETIKEQVAKEKKEAELEPVPVAKKSIEVGAHVTLAQGTDVGEVAAISTDRLTATVVFGAVKMRVRVGDLTRSEQRIRARVPAVEFSEKPETVETDIDVRGMTGDEAIPLVDKFLDTAILAGLRRVDIIHGKGTGALRKRITEFLSGHPRVQAFRLGEWNEGGTGATVVELDEHH